MTRSARPTPRGGTLSRTMSPPQPLIFSLDVREGSPHSHVGGISRVVRDDTTNMYGVCLELRGRVSLGTLDSDFKSIRKIRVPSSCRKQRNLYAFCSKVTAVCDLIGRFVQDTAPNLCLPFDGIGARHVDQREVPRCRAAMRPLECKQRSGTVSCLSNCNPL